MVLIDDPVLNSPFDEPTCHFKFDEDGITNEIAAGRRPSTHFVPIPRAKKKARQLLGRAADHFARRSSGTWRHSRSKMDL
jgi:hypothetical protein